MAYIEMTVEEWLEKYKPKRNEDGSIVGYETYGEDIAYVKKQNPLNIWTVCDDGESTFLLSGWHLVNRLHYVLAEVPFEKGDDIVIAIHDDVEAEGEEID